MNEEGTYDLPTEIADRLTRAFARILKIKFATGVMLFVATVVALNACAFYSPNSPLIKHALIKRVSS